MKLPLLLNTLPNDLIPEAFRDSTPRKCKLPLGYSRRHEPEILAAALS